MENKLKVDWHDIIEKFSSLNRNYYKHTLKRYTSLMIFNNLMKITSSQDDPIHVPLSYSELAKLSGYTEETIRRYIRDFVNMGIVQITDYQYEDGSKKQIFYINGVVDHLL